MRPSLRAWFIAVVFTGSLSRVYAQTPEPPPAATSAASPAAPLAAETQPAEGDRFEALREVAATAREAYQKTHKQNMAEIDRLLKTRRCQINRIGGLLDRTLDKLQEWSEPEFKFWSLWAEVEEGRVNEERKKVALMETDQERTKEIIETETRDREDLIRRRENLEKYGKRTRDVVQQMDNIIQDIRVSEAHLADAKQKFDDVAVKVANMNGIITARLVEIRQYKNSVESIVLKQKADYENLRMEAQGICNIKKPVSQRSSAAATSPN